MNKWKQLSNNLEKVYQEEGIYSSFKSDEVYLKNAFLITEKLWEEQFNNIDNINIIMIAESSLFGKIQKYIYNVNTKPSSFFYYQDLEAFPSYVKMEKPLLVQHQKEAMLKEFSKNGFLILDLFPFSFNEKDTSLNYRNMNTKLYKKLLEVSSEHYLIPKLKICLAKSNNENIHFIYRYKRLFHKTGNFFEKVLKEISNQEVKYRINTIHGSNMSLDRNKLTKLLLKVN